jgi:hypothetical protein
MICPHSRLEAFLDCGGKRSATPLFMDWNEIIRT